MVMRQRGVGCQEPPAGRRPHRCGRWCWRRRCRRFGDEGGLPWFALERVRCRGRRCSRWMLLPRSGGCPPAAGSGHHDGWRL